MAVPDLLVQQTLRWRLVSLRQTDPFVHLGSANDGFTLQLRLVLFILLAKRHFLPSSAFPRAFEGRTNRSDTMLT